MPERFPIVDSHLHLWDPRRFRMSWLDGNVVLDRPYLEPEYAEATAGLPLAAAVYLQVEVETPYAFLEARWAANLAHGPGPVAGLVAWAPIEYGDRSRAFIEALLELGPQLKGIRRIIQFEADPAFCLRPDFVQGVRLLAEYNLLFDLCVKGAEQMASVEQLVRDCPETQFVLDHLGKPDIASHTLEPWRSQVVKLANLPNVACKVSGMVTEADHRAWTADDLRPYVDHVHEAFGDDRLLFGGDWPVVVQASAYKRWVHTLQTLTGDWSATAQQKLWADNARRIYGLR